VLRRAGGYDWGTMGDREAQRPGGPTRPPEARDGAERRDGEGEPAPPSPPADPEKHQLVQPTTGEGATLSPSADLPPLASNQLEALSRIGAAWRAYGPPPSLPIDPSLPAHELRLRPTRLTRVVAAVPFRPGPDHGVEADRSAVVPVSRLGQALSRLRWSVLGPPLRSSAVFEERMPKITALPILASDLLSSVAYGPEALVGALLVAGSRAAGLSLPIAAGLVVLMLAVGISYRQTIRAYPSGAGSYIVAGNNLGEVPGILAAVGLLIDYILTVSVSIAAGVAAITSAAPSLRPYTVEIGLAAISLILIGNLRGVRQAGYIFMVPTYAFVAIVYLLILVGLVRAGVHGFHAVPPPHVAPIEGVSVLLIGRAFASGATSMTGIEAVSNATPSFRPPEWRHARTTLGWMIVLLVGMFVGLILLVHFQGVIPQHGESVLSQLGHRAFGGGVLYGVLQATTALILVLAANTAYNDFPRLLFFMAANDHAPRRFLRMGERLVFINGILVLTGVAALLFAVFHGQTETLIPLYAVGVFLAFTLSQAGMVRHWFTEHGPGWRRSAAINAVGATLSGLVLVIAAVTKFTGGAWLVVVAVPGFSAASIGIRRFYQRLTAQLDVARVAGQAEPAPTAPADPHSAPEENRHLIVVPVSRMNRANLHALAYARSLGVPVLAVHVSPEEDEAKRFQQGWQAWGGHVPLEVIHSPYRSVVLPVTRYVSSLHQLAPQLTITVVIPEIEPAHWWHRPLLSSLAPRLRHTLRSVPGVIVASVPLHVP
jgi:amino acid transporter